MTRYSQRSVEMARAHPATFLRASDTIGWEALFVQELILARETPPFVSPATDDQALIVQLSGTVSVEADQGDGKHKAVGQAGSLASAASGRPTVARWTTLGHDPVRAIHIYLPAAVLAAAEEEFRPAGRLKAPPSPLALGYDDPVIYAIAGRLLASIDHCEPDLYAQSLAHFLAAHLQLAHRFANAQGRQVGAPTDRRIARVVDRMTAEFRRSISVEELAREACVSPFHFTRLFKRSTGRTPYEFLTSLRMKRAAEMLKDRDMSIKSIANACGYQNHAAFTSAFRRWSGSTPRAWRAKS